MLNAFKDGFLLIFGGFGIISSRRQIFSWFWPASSRTLACLTSYTVYLGTKFFERLSKDLKKSFPDMTGISPCNLKYMQSFTEAYPSFLQMPLA